MTPERALELVRAELRVEAMIRDAEGRQITGAEMFALAGTFTVEWAEQVDRDHQSGDPESHEFQSVAGHPDDDECTHRQDGTDATYCGEPRAAHQSGDPS